MKVGSSKLNPHGHEVDFLKLLLLGNTIHEVYVQIAKKRRKKENNKAREGYRFVVSAPPRSIVLEWSQVMTDKI